MVTIAEDQITLQINEVKQLFIMLIGSVGHNSDRGCGDDLGLRSPEDSLTHSLTRLLTDGGYCWDLSTYKQPLYVA